MQIAKWCGFDFEVQNPNVNWSENAGIYIFAGASNNYWHSKYVGQASSFKQRLNNHERWKEAVRLGATHIHAMVVNSQSERDKIENSLIKLLQPPLNEQLK